MMRNLATGEGSERVRSSLGSLIVSVALAFGSTLSLPAIAFADEDGVSFWIPGFFGSLAAVPQQVAATRILIRNSVTSFLP
jgi:hypothetical protein